MRVFRTILGMLALTIGLPSLLAGAGLWAAMQHRDEGGAFSGRLQQLSTPGYALVIEDVDGLLRSDAPFTRLGDTQLRLLGQTQKGPAFFGLAPTNAVRDYLAGVQHSRVRTVDIGTGALPVATTIVPGTTAPRVQPGQAPFWTRANSAGQISWTPSEVRGGPYSLVVMSADATPGMQLRATAELRPGWLNSSAWGLLTLGTLLVMVGMVVLAWPARRREIVYVVEPSQVPDLMRAIGAPMPALPTAGRPVGAHRPRSLADARPGPAPAVMAWPPAPALTAAAVSSPAAAPGVPPDPAEYAAATAIPSRQPAPGEPLQYLGAGAASLPLGEPSTDQPAARRPAAKRATPVPGDIPMFQPSAVEAWVAETAPVRARETEAQAAARLAEAARRRAAAGADRPGASSPASPRTPMAADAAVPVADPASRAGAAVSAAASAAAASAASVAAATAAAKVGAGAASAAQDSTETAASAPAAPTAPPTAAPASAAPGSAPGSAGAAGSARGPGAAPGPGSARGAGHGLGL